MTKVENAGPQTLPVKPENIITLPLGLLGFEQVKKFVLLALPGEEPFMWLQMLDNRNQGFVVVPPATVMPGYAPDIVQQDIEFLGIQSAADAIVLNIVTIRSNGETTINLKGPVIINRNSLVGKQCIPSNVTTFNLQHAIQPVSVAA